MKNKRGYFGIGCINMKTTHNYGTLFRTAQILEADFLFTIGAKFKPQASDTMKSWKHLPVFRYDTFEIFQECRPYDCRLVGIELDSKARPLKNYTHPERCMYLLGAEDVGISREVRDKCNDLIVLPGERSMNVAVAGSIVLYDRISKLK